MGDQRKHTVFILILFFASYSLGREIFVDNQLTDDCVGTYSIALRNNSGSDGDAYDTLQEAANVVGPGDTVLIRNGTYHLDGISPVSIIRKNGTADAKIIIRNYGSEEVIIDATNVNEIWNGYHGIYVVYSEHVIINGLTVRNSPGNGIIIYGADYVEILNCTVHSNGGAGIKYQDSSYAIVNNCEVYGNGGGIYVVGGKKHSGYPVITNNLVYNHNVSNPEGADGIAFGGLVDYGLIKGNIIFYSWDDGIDSSTGSMYTTIEDNIAFYQGDGPAGEGDGNGIKVSTGNSFGSGGGHTVRYNIAFDNEASGFDQCKEPNNPQNWFYNNIAYSNDVYGIYLESDAGYLDEAAIVYNCILANNALLDMRDRFGISVNTSDYNLWSTNWAGQSPREGPHSILADPKFNNPNLVIDTNFQSGWTLAQKKEYIRSQVREKFGLRAGSPAIDSGRIIAGYHNPSPGDNAGNLRVWYGSAPDMGAYEIALNGLADLSVSSTSQNSVTFTWTVPGGQDYRKPTQYDIRYADIPITDATWDAATQVQGEPVPGDFGNEQSFTLTGLNSGTTYYVAIKTSDELGNVSWLSNVVSGTTTTSGNHAPVLGPIGDQSVFETQELKFVVSATDADGDTLVYSATRIPTGASFDPATRTFGWTPTNTQSGTYRVTFQVSDGQVTVSQTITITVNESNQPPTANAGPDQAITDSDGNGSEQVALNASGSTDPDGTIQSYAWTEGSSQIATGVNPTVTLAVGQHTITLTVTDNGGLTSTDTVTITVSASSGSDNIPPTVTLSWPQNDVQVPVNSLIVLHVLDNSSGVDANSVAIKVNGNTVYIGNTAKYTSQTGNCRRTGTKADYTLTHQPNEIFDFEQEVTITVNANDLGGNAMAEYSYSFWTEMPSFGKNKKVSSGLDNSSCGSPATVRDSNGNIWVVWHAGPVGSRDVYLAKLVEGADTFGSRVQVTTDSADQCNPTIALGGSDKLYVVWQDNRRGNWDVYMSSSADGINWSESRVSDSNNNEISPAIAIGSAGRAAVAWQDDRAGNQDIYLATSSDGFVTKTVSQITSHSANQVEPAIAVGSDNTVYVVWADYRNSSTDIYGAASNNGWANVPVVSKVNNQSSPVIAAEAAGSILHLLWVDDTPGNKDIFHAATDGLPSSPLVGSSIIDDSSGADQLGPAIAVTGSTGSNLKVFACWQDRRNVAGSSVDTDIYFVELTSDGKTNIFVGDDGTNANQSEPVLGVDRYGHPYAVWADGRNTNPQIYYAGSTYLSPEPVVSELVSASVGEIVGTSPANIDSVDDVSVIIPPGACPCDVQITISEIKNPQEFTVQCLAAYDFGPSGIQFNGKVRITIPYAYSGSGAKPYWFNSLTGALSQQGITNIQDREISAGLHALSFDTTHFTAFYAMSGSIGGGGGGGGGGGCALSHSQEGSVAGFLLPYGALALLMFILKLKDRRCKAG